MGIRQHEKENIDEHVSSDLLLLGRSVFQFFFFFFKNSRHIWMILPVTTRLSIVLHSRGRNAALSPAAPPQAPPAMHARAGMPGQGMREGERPS